MGPNLVSRTIWQKMEANLISYVDGCFQISLLSGISKLNLNNEVIKVVETGKDINILIPWKLLPTYFIMWANVYYIHIKNAEPDPEIFPGICSIG